MIDLLKCLSILASPILLSFEYSNFSLFYFILFYFHYFDFFLPETLPRSEQTREVVWYFARKIVYQVLEDLYTYLSTWEIDEDGDWENVQDLLLRFTDRIEVFSFLLSPPFFYISHSSLLFLFLLFSILFFFFFSSSLVGKLEGVQRLAHGLLSSFLSTAELNTATTSGGDGGRCR